jgi:predicted pyridoxine 5'-phosphate oxidase superfamily flavin-nucleotide-binding protein
MVCHNSGMGKAYENISDEHRAFIEQQPVFFVASAPVSADGHVNVSPKGLDSLRVVDRSTVVYLDLTGSGNETAAHLVENGRLTLMFCAFDGNPKVLRLYCRGRVVTRGSAEWESWLSHFPPYPGIRQIVVADVVSVRTSCGFGVPLMTLVAQRDQLPRWAEHKGEDGLVEYRRARNAVSLDGLLPPAPDPA